MSVTKITISQLRIWENAVEDEFQKKDHPCRDD